MKAAKRKQSIVVCANKPYSATDVHRHKRIVLEQKGRYEQQIAPTLYKLIHSDNVPGQLQAALVLAQINP